MTDTGAISPGTVIDGFNVQLITSADDGYGQTGGGYGLYSGSYTVVGQSFAGNGSVLDSVKFLLNKSGSPTGNAVAKIYTHSGTFGTNSLPTGSPLATSDNLDVTTLSTSRLLKTLTFSGTNKILLSSGTNYIVVFEFSGGDSSNYVKITENFDGSWSGNICYYGGSWSSSYLEDLIFYIYGGIGTVAWTNPDNAKVSDNVYATASGAKPWTSHYLKATNFGFSIPSGAIINGILVEIEEKGSTPSPAHESAIKIVKADGTIGTTNKSTGATLPSSDTYISYGSDSDLWDETWDDTKINDIDFGVVFSIAGNGGTGGYVDHIRITVYYTETGSTSTSISSSISSSISTSVSSSLSSSISASPSAGYQDYTKGDYVSLPSNNTDLTNIFTEQEITDVATKDNVRVSQDGTGYVLHQFKDFVGNALNITLEWEGQTNEDCSLSPVLLQIYNQITTNWDTVDTDSSSPADTDFTLTGTVNSTNYQDASSVISCRVYQQLV